MKLDKITLKNFRCYRDLTVELDPVMTVLVGNNGMGKTALLDAIRISLWAYLNSFDLARTAYADPANTITVNDVLLLKTDTSMMSRQIPSEIEMTGDYGEGLKTWKRFRNSEAPRSQTKDGPGTQHMKKYGKALQALIRDVNEDPVDLPIFAYYGTGRLWKEKRLTQGKKGNSNLRKGDENIRTFAYRDCLDPASSYKQFEEWFASSFLKIRELQINYLETDIASVKLGTSSLKSVISSFKIDPEIQDPVTVVQQAVNVLLKDTDWQNPVYSQTHDKSLVLQHPEKGVLKINQLSDGIKNMVAMIADLAYRCSLLNSHMGAEAALETNGVVMIDEVDMHLHPKWQQTVVNGLTEAFPNIQFLLTTHSPQVLSTVDSECIRVLEDGHAYQAPRGSKGAESSRILKQVLGVDLRPPDENNTRILKSYLELVYKDQWNDPEAVTKRRILDEIFGNQEPALTEADLYIENRKWELDIEAD